jgi:hypothetical protein
MPESKPPGGLTEKGWRERALRIETVLTRLENEVMAADRVARVPPERQTARSQPGLIAFGQYVSRAMAGEGQYGVYGSAAGLEILASLAGKPVERERWRTLLLGDWLYLQHELFPDEPLQPAEQHALVLREAQVLRALASVRSTFHEEVTRSPKSPPSDADEYARAIRSSEQWGSGAGDVLFAARMLEELGRSRELRLEVELSEQTLAGAKTVPGYRFASNSPDSPIRDLHWAFHESAVLSALVRCSWCGLVTDDDFADLWSLEDTRFLFRWTKEVLADPRRGEFRVALFAGWALSHLDPHCFGTNAVEQGRRLRNLHVEPPDDWHTSQLQRTVGLTETEFQQLGGLLSRAVRAALADPLRRSDLHVPYFYRVTTGTEVHWRQEHFVVPTVPIMLSLVARYDERLLFTPALSTLLNSVVSALSKAPNDVVTGQGSDANGSVNMTYLHESLGEVHDRCLQIACRRSIWRAASVMARPLPSSDAIQTQGLKLSGSFAVGVASGLVVALIT